MPEPPVAPVAPVGVGQRRRWAAGARPKVGGVLDQVLSRAGAKQGASEALTPGEAGLLKQFSGQLGPVGVRQSPLPAPPNPEALNVVNEFKPWAGLAKIRGLIGL